MVFDPDVGRRKEHNPLNSKEHLIAALKAFFALAEKWQLTSNQARILLGQPSERTFFNWKMGKVGRPSHDTMSRLGYLLGIHKALRVLFSNPENLYGWVGRENDDFGGQAPLDRMLAGDVTDLAYVRQYLDSVRGGWA